MAAGIPLPDDDPDGRRRLLLPGLPSPDHDALYRILAGDRSRAPQPGRDRDRRHRGSRADGPARGASGAAGGRHQRAADDQADPAGGRSGALGGAAAGRPARRAPVVGATWVMLLVRRPLITKTTFVSRADPTPRGFDAEEIEEFLPLKVRGVILHDPFTLRCCPTVGPADRSSAGPPTPPRCQLGQNLARPPSPAPARTRPIDRRRHDSDSQDRLARTRRRSRDSAAEGDGGGFVMRRASTPATAATPRVDRRRPDTPEVAR